MRSRSRSSLFVLALIASFGGTFANGVAHAGEPSSAQGQKPKRIEPMSDQHFWTLIGTTTAFESDPERQLAALHAALAKLSIDEIEAYESVFDAMMKRSYAWDLWGAAYVVHGGASDDGFEYFRCWLISKGQGVFEKVIADPDSLADMLAPKIEGVLEFEEFAYVARDVWGEKAGRPGREMPNAAWMAYPGREPSGTRFEEDAADLAKRYPKLWRRFGTNPLG
jgi:hypothetical protein